LNNFQKYQPIYVETSDRR